MNTKKVQVKQTFKDGLSYYDLAGNGSVRIQDVQQRYIVGLNRGKVHYPRG